MRKSLAALLAGLLLIGAIGCGRSEPSKNPTRPSAPEKSAPAPPPPVAPK